MKTFSALRALCEGESIGPLTWIITLIPVWIDNHTHYKVWDEIAHPILKLQWFASLQMPNIDGIPQVYIIVSNPST